ncbi:Uncharacterised protein [Mycobacteroides abscessus subsp. abscessus]|nr:hypothetical protein [Mycobacteroides franklinii]SHT24996.1 Uncharacterised protein [Mycobacteroides abscessus subsp. abscessus]SHW68748.1 Uncharacterised protein [Mycobacteroides abscessus subsp. abscessus]SHY70503.1 Uncharacterised protein [Mycobacteroides abscessus subsp. abscessus]SHZ44650.1 Uncharacterised protein [Mycobacteroides abscessus subsp. abscessus]
MGVLAVVLGLVLLIPAGYVALMLLAAVILEFFAGGMPKWVELMVIWGGVIASTVAGIWLISWGVR